jgi:hypothetical protein
MDDQIRDYRRERRALSGKLEIKRDVAIGVVGAFAGSFFAAHPMIGCAPQ